MTTQKKKRPDQDAEKCPTCHGEGVVQGRYTESAPIVCPTCDGGMVVPAGTEAEPVEEPESGAEGD